MSISPVHIDSTDTDFSISTDDAAEVTTNLSTETNGLHVVIEQASGTSETTTLELSAQLVEHVNRVLRDNVKLQIGTKFN